MLSHRLLQATRNTANTGIIAHYRDTLTVLFFLTADKIQIFSKRSYGLIPKFKRKKNKN